MSLFDDLIQNETVSGIRSRIVTLAQEAQLAVTDWIQGGIGQQIIEVMTSSGFATSSIVSKAIRGFASLDTSVDPGDEDPFDSTNVTLEPGPGLLSNFGENTFGTPRIEDTFASGFVTFDNSLGLVARTFGPDSLVFTWTDNTPPTPAPTYRNSPDPLIYVNFDGTVTVLAGATLVIPVAAEEEGARSSCPALSLSLTTALVGVTATNDDAIVGQDREAAPDYRARCRQAPARVSLGGPQDAYRYFSRTNLDGTPLLNASGNPVATTRSYVSQDSATGIVQAFFAGPSGPSSGEDVDAANTNITTQVLAVPDAITYSGAAATGVSIHVVGTAKIKAAPGVTQTAVKQAIVDALSEAFADFPIGGFDQVAGAGVIYTVDLQGIARGAFLGLYDVVVTTPAGATTPLALGEVATLNSVPGDWTVLIT